MADKRTDKDDNVKEERSWQFIQEKIVRQPAVIKKADRQIYYIDCYLCSTVWDHIGGLFYSYENGSQKDNGTGKNRRKPFHYNTER